MGFPHTCAMLGIHPTASPKHPPPLAHSNAPKTVSSKDITIAVEAKGEGNYFLVPSWDSGTMEPGSSGSALVDATNGTVVGTLTGTPTRSACSRTVPTVFAKLHTVCTGTYTHVVVVLCFVCGTDPPSTHMRTSPHIIKHHHIPSHNTHHPPPQAWQLYGLWDALGGDGPNQPMRMPGVRPDIRRLQLQVAPDVLNIKDRRYAPTVEYIAFKYVGGVGCGRGGVWEGWDVGGMVGFCC